LVNAEKSAVNNCSPVSALVIGPATAPENTAAPSADRTSVKRGTSLVSVACLGCPGKKPMLFKRMACAATPVPHQTKTQALQMKADLKTVMFKSS
jgi:hypothetical protein